MQIQKALSCAVVCSFTLLGDSLVLKSGRTVNGTYVGGDARTIKMLANDRVETFDVAEVRSIRFGSGSGDSSASPQSAAGDLAPSSSPATSSNVTPRRPMTPEGVAPKPAQEAARGLTVPAGTNMIVRLIDDVDSERDQIGKTYRASLDESLMVDGVIAVPKGTDVTLKLTDDKQSGKLTGKTVLTLDVDSLTIGGQQIEVQTGEITQESKSQTARTGKATVGVAALGAVIGGIAGGGKGAAIGAGAGAAAGAGSQVLFKGQRVRVPSETRLTFSLQQPVRL